MIKVNTTLDCNNNVFLLHQNDIKLALFNKGQWIVNTTYNFSKSFFIMLPNKPQPSCYYRIVNAPFLFFKKLKLSWSLEIAITNKVKVLDTSPMKSSTYKVVLRYTINSKLQYFENIFTSSKNIVVVGLYELDQKTAHFKTYMHWQAVKLQNHSWRSGKCFWKIQS